MAADPEVRRVAARVLLKWTAVSSARGRRRRLQGRSANAGWVAPHRRFQFPAGDRRHPLSYAEVADKFLTNCCDYMPKAGILKLIDCVRDAENQSVEHLMSAAR